MGRGLGKRVMGWEETIFSRIHVMGIGHFQLPGFYMTERNRHNIWRKI